jgi:hypothetical protein
MFARVPQIGRHVHCAASALATLPTDALYNILRTAVHGTRSCKHTELHTASKQLSSVQRMSMNVHLAAPLQRTRNQWAVNYQCGKIRGSRKLRLVSATYRLACFVSHRPHICHAICHTCPIWTYASQMLACIQGGANHSAPGLPCTSNAYDMETCNDGSTQPPILLKQIASLLATENCMWPPPQSSRGAPL